MTSSLSYTSSVCALEIRKSKSDVPLSKFLFSTMARFSSSSLIIKPENVTASYVFDELKRNWIDEDMVFRGQIHLGHYSNARRRPPGAARPIFNARGGLLGSR